MTLASKANVRQLSMMELFFFFSLILSGTIDKRYIEKIMGNKLTHI